MKFEGTKDYIATEDLRIAVNASISLERPLLVKGEPGTGKTVLAEEIARVVGYDNIEKKIINLPVNQTSSEISLDDKVRSFLVRKGFSEVINFPFSENEDTESVEIDNPLDSKKRFFRKNITESILKNI